MSQLDQLTGVVDKIIFCQSDTGFIVFSLIPDRMEKVTVSGHAANVHAGQHVSVTGTWTVHPKFGRQFQAQQCTMHAPTSIVGLKKYLGSGLIKGIGPAYAEKIVDYFGSTVLEIIDAAPERLREVPGIGSKRVTIIMDAWQEQKNVAHVMVFLQERGISATYATKIYKKYGNESIALITENPYRLAEDIWGVGFKIADEIAKKLGFSHNSSQRITAGLLYTLSTVVSAGSLYSELDQLKQVTTELLLLEQSDAKTVSYALHTLHDQGKIKLVSFQDQHFITLSQYYFSEKSVAQKIRALTARTKEPQININEVYDCLRTAQTKIELNEDQQRGIMTCLQHPITVITGGPGTGKTTLIKQLIQILKKGNYRYKLAAPTGRAAKRITENTGEYASTIHRLLEFDVSIMGFSRTEQHALELDFLIIDEASMIDIFLANAVIKAVPLNAQIVFIGDVDQLPSVGAGNFLRDLIKSETVPVISLIHIFRQAQDSLIIRNAHKINHGEFPVSYEDGAKKDFIYIKEDDPACIKHHLTHLYTTVFKQHGITPYNTIVLTPMNRTIAGTYQLNLILQELLNPSVHAQQLTYAGTTFKVGDRVMQIRNNYDRGVFNGDMGTIETIDSQEQSATIQFIDKSIVYEQNELDELTLAYAITIHKSQGSEFAGVIVPLFMQHFTLLQRNLLYTAITRAKKICIFIGQPKAIGMAINNTKELERTTFLYHYLTSDLQCR